MSNGRHMRPREGRKIVREADGSLVEFSWFWTTVNSDRVPSKADGRKGTRRAWKRAHPPGWQFRQFERLRSRPAPFLIGDEADSYPPAAIKFGPYAGSAQLHPEWYDEDGELIGDESDG